MFKGPVSWTDPKLVGDTNCKTSDGSPVIINSLALSQFTNYMKSLNLDFEYDTAVGLFAYELIISLKTYILNYLSNDV